MNRVVVIGGSAGSIGVLKHLLKELPVKLSYSILIVIHQKEQCNLTLVETLKSTCRHPIIDPIDGTEILEGYIYVAPPMYHMQVECDETISFSLDEPIKFSRPSIDVLFETAAWVYKSQVLGIVLSGASNDGTDGAKEIVKHHGKVVVQDTIEAESSMMPTSVKQALNLKDMYTTIQLASLLKHWRN